MVLLTAAGVRRGDLSTMPQAEVELQVFILFCYVLQIYGNLRSFYVEIDPSQS